MRDNSWLSSRLDLIWQNNFADVERKNTVVIRFGRFARYQFGVISYDRAKDISTIRINRMFASETIPEAIVDHTIAHELVHYSHGFSSPHKRRHRYPHHGGVVNKDLKERSLEHLLKAYKLWLKEYRKTFAA